MKKLLSKEFDINDSGVVKKILGIEITRENGVVHIFQKSYINKVLERFNMYMSMPVRKPLASHFKLTELQMPQSMDEVKQMPKFPYARIIGIILYPIVWTLPDIAQSVSLLRRYMANLGKNHWETIKWLLRYLKGAPYVCLTFRKKWGILILGYADSDYERDTDQMRSTTRYIRTLVGSDDIWKPTIQSIGYLSTTVIEYLAAT